MRAHTGVAHLPGNHAVDIVLHGHEVDHREVSSGAALVLEVPIVAIAPEMGDGFDTVLQAGTDRQRDACASVELEEDPAGARPDHRDAAAAGANRLSSRRAQGGCRGVGLATGEIGPRPHIVCPFYPGWKPAGHRHSRLLRRLKGAVRRRELNVPAAHRNVRGDGVIIPGPVPHLAVIDVLGLDHGDGALPRTAHRAEPRVPVKIAETIARTHIVEQVGAGQGAASVKQPHPYHILLRRVRC